MLSQYFRRPSSVAQLHAGPFGHVVEEFAAHLHERGYAFKVGQGCVRSADRITRWLAAKGLSLGSLDERRCQAFLRTRTGRSRLAFTRDGVRRFLQMLRARGIVPMPPIEPASDVDRLVAEYDAYLREVAGLATASRVSRTRFAREFLQKIFGDREIHTERLLPKHVHAFVASFGRAGCFASVPVAGSSLRRFVRWLQIQGRCSPDLIRAVPSFRTHRHASLPKVLTDRQIHLLLGTFDRSTPVGRRDYAMTLCQLDLGLRASEVAALTLEDIDWRNGTIRIAAGKSHRDRLLPLSKRVGRAVIEYLQRGRPTTMCRSLFVRFTIPAGTSATCKVVRGAVRRAFAKVEGCKDWTGTHPLRHTAATRMYRRGASLKHVADVLGHRCLDTTAIYAKVNLEQLAAVANGTATLGTPASARRLSFPAAQVRVIGKQPLYFRVHVVPVALVANQLVSHRFPVLWIHPRSSAHLHQCFTVGVHDLVRLAAHPTQQQELAADEDIDAVEPILVDHLLHLSEGRFPIAFPVEDAFKEIRQLAEVALTGQ